MVPVSVAVGGAMCAGVAAAYVAGLVEDPASEALYGALLEAAMAVSNVLSLAAVVVVALRAHTAPAAEVRRVVLFSLGLLVWMGMATAYDFVEVFSPGFWLSNYDSGSSLRLMQPMRFPGMVLLWYSVLAVRVPHPREAVRASCRRLLMGRGRLWLTAAALWAAVGWLAAGYREQTPGPVLPDPLAQLVFAAAAITLLLLAGREEILTPPGRMDPSPNGGPVGSVFITPDAAFAAEVRTNVYQAAWVRPHTNRLLFEAGASRQPIRFAVGPSATAVTGLPGVFEVAPGAVEPRSTRLLLRRAVQSDRPAVDESPGRRRQRRPPAGDVRRLQRVQREHGDQGTVRHGVRRRSELAGAAGDHARPIGQGRFPA